MHEHLLVDFIGASEVSRDRYDADEVVRLVLPHLRKLRERGCDTLVECTPAYLGRDPALLRRLSEASDVNLITNTGYYGAADDKYIPPHAYGETADELAARWTAELRHGIEGTGVRPSFQKIGVDAGPLSAIDRKLVVAAARCHLQTGLTVAVHTGDGEAALEVIATLKREGVAPSAYVWVHSQSEKDRAVHVRAAEAGAWIELDGISEKGLADSLQVATELIRRGHLTQLLVSQDAGWYHVGEPGGGTFRPFTFLIDTFVPALRERGIADAQIRTLLVENPARALTPLTRAVPPKGAAQPKPPRSKNS